MKPTATPTEDDFDGNRRLLHDWRSQHHRNASGQPGNTLDVRLETTNSTARNPNNRFMGIAIQQWAVFLSGKNYITFRDLNFRRFKGISLVPTIARAINFDGCDIRYMGRLRAGVRCVPERPLRELCARRAREQCRPQ